MSNQSAALATHLPSPAAGRGVGGEGIPEAQPLLAVRDLTVEFQTRGGALRAVNDVSFTVGKGNILAILGESGSGKSMLLKTILGIQSRAGKVTGEVVMRDTNLLTLSPKARQETRGSWVSMIFQNPMTALDPVFTVEQQIVETIRRHTTMSKAEARQRALDLLELVQIPSPEQRLKSYPFECSGGMRQRIVIALALACNPSLLLADEPTTALDVTVQARVLDLIRDVQQKLGMSVILVTHDIAVAAEIADEVIVMYAGRIVEQGPIRVILRDPRHPYTRGLLGANVKPGQHERPLAIPGAPPNLAGIPNCCTFAPRCTLVRQECWMDVPALTPVGEGHVARCVLANDAALTQLPMTN
jgi:oligopeptide/dipeptide ABC transporter ATP-binding protein